MPHFRCLIGAVCLFGLAACDDGGARLMQKSLMGQMTALCPGSAFVDPAEFATRVERLGLSPDGGAFRSDPSMEVEIIDQRWVASTALDERTAIWRGTYGPGEFRFRSIMGVNSSSSFSAGGYERRPFERAEVCVAFAPELTRADAITMAGEYGMDPTSHMWAAARNSEGRAVTTSYRMINVVRALDWHEMEFMFPADSGERGVMIVRRYFLQSASEDTPRPVSEDPKPAVPG